MQGTSSARTPTAPPPEDIFYQPQQPRYGPPPSYTESIGRYNYNSVPLNASNPRPFYPPNNESTDSIYDSRESVFYKKSTQELISFCSIVLAASFVISAFLKIITPAMIFLGCLYLLLAVFLGLIFAGGAILIITCLAKMSAT